MDLVQYDSVSKVRVSHVHFRWTIENFSNCFDLNEKNYSSDVILRSAAFDMVDSSKWQLQITLEGKANNFRSDPCYSIRLIPLDKINENMRVQGSISVLASDGSVGLKFACNKLVTPKFFYINFNEQRLLSFNVKYEHLLVNDTLTLLCQLKVTDVAISTSVLKKKGLERLFGHPLHSDIIFVADGKEFHAHKVLVADRCPVLFKKNPRKKQQMNRIEVPEGAQVFKELLRFIYTGKCENLQSMAQDLLVVAEKYKVPKLKSVCEQELIIKQTNDAHLQGASGLKRKHWNSSITTGPLSSQKKG
jgi:speckle-type POZ protein